MKIALCYSMQFAEKAREVKAWLEHRGHKAFPSNFNEKYLGLSDSDKESLKLEHKYNQDAIREHWNVIQNCDAVLVLNYSKNGIENYIRLLHNSNLCHCEEQSGCERPKAAWQTLDRHAVPPVAGTTRGRLRNPV